MNKNDLSMDLIPYSEMIKIIIPKFNATEDEIRYWVKLANYDDTILDDPKFNYLIPFSTDFPIGEEYLRPPPGFFYPQYYFYNRQLVHQFAPSSFLRFVYRKDLTGKRNWHDLRMGTTDSVVYRTLYRANECGILQIYDRAKDEFTLYANDSHLWCHLYPEDLNHPDSFFLLFDILNIERIFFNKRKDVCLQELGDYSLNHYTEDNVIKFTNTKIKGKNSDEEI